MKGNVERTLLAFAVFFSGAVIMGYEITGARIMGPYTGTSYEVWTAVIGVMLIFLSVGYWAGGLLSDRNPTRNKLAYFILTAGIYMILTVWLYKPLLTRISHSGGNMAVPALLASLVLFAVPSFFLGMVSPYATRLLIKDTAQAGKIAGTLYALSTAGSILGVIAAGFWLIPQFFLSNILLIYATVLIIISLLLNVPINEDN
ncbi:MAG: hypothetical protein Kow00127_06800 [Bacteroidales bacterium]